jgi:hypothetical protein
MAYLAVGARAGDGVGSVAAATAAWGAGVAFAWHVCGKSCCCLVWSAECDFLVGCGGLNQCWVREESFMLWRRKVGLGTKPGSAPRRLRVNTTSSNGNMHGCCRYHQPSKAFKIDGPTRLKNLWQLPGDWIALAYTNHFCGLKLAHRLGRLITEIPPKILYKNRFFC